MAQKILQTAPHQNQLESTQLPFQDIEILSRGLAHDFNNLLNGIMAHLNVLELKSSNFTNFQKNKIKHLTNSVRRGGAIVEQFQNIYNKKVQTKSTRDIYEIAKDAFILLEDMTDKKIDIKIDFEPGQFLIPVHSDEIHRVLLNLGVNALQAIKKKGIGENDYIRLSFNPDPTGDARPGYFLQKDFYHMCFEDTGIGMSEEVLKKAFDPLFSTKTDTENKGQGLGLAMVYNIITNSHSGHINIASDIGKGTVFNIFLPKKDS